MKFLQMPTTHMDHATGTSGINFSDLFFGTVILSSFALILITITLLLIFKDQIRSRFNKKPFYDESDFSVHTLKKSIYNHPEIENDFQENFIEENNLSLSIDEQAYQRERLMNLINNYPEGILQSKLPYLTNLSKATVSRRLSELVESELILRKPRGRSILIIPKNA